MARREGDLYSSYSLRDDLERMDERVSKLEATIADLLGEARYRARFAAEGREYRTRVWTRIGIAVGALSGLAVLVAAVVQIVRGVA